MHRGCGALLAACLCFVALAGLWYWSTGLEPREAVQQAFLMLATGCGWALWAIIAIIGLIFLAVVFG